MLWLGTKFMVVITLGAVMEVFWYENKEVL